MILRNQFNELKGLIADLSVEVSSKADFLTTEIAQIKANILLLQEQQVSLNTIANSKLLDLGNRVSQLENGYKQLNIIKTELASLTAEHYEAIRKIDNVVENQRKINKFNFIALYAIASIATILSIIALIY